MRPVFDPRHADHGVAGDEGRQRVLIKALRSRRALRHHEEADVGGGIMHPQGHIVGELRAEFAQHRARLAHHAGAIGAALVPGGRQAQEIARVAGAEGADHDIVGVRRVLHRHQLGAGDGEAQLGGGRVAIFEQARAIGRINPGAGHHLGAIGGGDGIALLDELAHLRGGDDALFDQEFLQRDAEDLVIAVHLVVGLGRRMGVIMIVVMVMVMVVVMILVILAHPIVSSQWS